MSEPLTGPTAVQFESYIELRAHILAGSIVATQKQATCEVVGLMLREEDQRVAGNRGKGVLVTWADLRLFLAASLRDGLRILGEDT